MAFSGKPTETHEDPITRFVEVLYQCGERRFPMLVQVMPDISRYNTEFSDHRFSPVGSDCDNEDTVKIHPLTNQYKEWCKSRIAKSGAL